MKRIILLTLLIPVLAHAQRYGHTSAGAAGAGSTANVRANTGWTASGTLARDTLYTNYAIFGAKTFGVGGTTQAQNARAKFNVLGRAANDTLAIFSNDGGGVVGDSSTFVNAAGRWSIKGGSLATSSVYLSTGGYMQATNGFISGGTEGVQHASTGSAYNFSASNNNLHLKPIQQVMINVGTAATSQAFVTIRSGGTADTTFMVRNDKNATLDSTFMVFANGDIDAGGNNFYHGANRIRAVTGDTAFVFYAGTTQVFAILADGTTADLVAGTPPTLWRNIPPQEYIWLLRIGVFLLLLLSILMIYDFVTKLRAKRAQRERLKLLASYAIQRTDI